MLRTSNRDKKYSKIIKRLSAFDIVNENDNIVFVFSNDIFGHANSFLVSTDKYLKYCVMGVIPKVTVVEYSDITGVSISRNKRPCINVTTGGGDTHTFEIYASLQEAELIMEIIKDYR